METPHGLTKQDLVDQFAEAQALRLKYQPEHGFYPYSLGRLEGTVRGLLQGADATARHMAADPVDGLARVEQADIDKVREALALSHLLTCEPDEWAEIEAELAPVAQAAPVAEVAA